MNANTIAKWTSYVLFIAFSAASIHVASFAPALICMIVFLALHFDSRICQFEALKNEMSSVEYRLEELGSAQEARLRQIESRLTSQSRNKDFSKEFEEIRTELNAVQLKLGFRLKKE